MTNTVIHKKEGDSQCRSCNQIFKHKDLKVKQVKRYGVLIEEKICPHCGGHTYGIIDYPISEEELIYKNSKFYIYKMKDIKRYLGKIGYNNTY